MTLEELKDKLRSDLSNPPEDELTDKQAGDAVLAAVSQYSRYRPIRNFGVIYSSRGKDLYDLSDCKRIIRVMKVYYYIGFQWIFQDIFPDPNLSGRLEGINLFENPSIWIQYMQRLEQYQKIFDGQWEYDKQKKQLRLIPEPTFSNRPIPFRWTQTHTTETLPEEEVDDIMMWAQAQAKRAMSNQKAREITQVSGYGQSVTIGISSEKLLEQAKDLENDFRNRFGAVTVFGRG